MNTLIIGLGNPGPQYEYTRHNVGYRAISFIHKAKKMEEFRSEKNYLFSVGNDKKNKMILILPTTFVNNTGQAVKEVTKKFKVGKKLNSSSKIHFLSLVLIHDDNDLPIGKVKMSIGKSSGGHKGVESVIKAIKTQDFLRFRIGIQPLKGKHKKAEQIVLKKFSPEEDKLIQKAIKKTAEAVEVSIQESVDKAYNIMASV